MPNALFDEEDQEHNHTIWRQPLGGPASAPAPDPALYGTYSPVQDLKGTVKAQVRTVTQKATKKTAQKSSRRSSN